MLIKVQKWGNSLALRIPKAFAVSAHLEKDSVVDLSFVDGEIVVKPVISPVWTLEMLLDGITAENIHEEFSTSSVIGNEIW